MEKESNVIYAVTYAICDRCEYYLHTETKICMSEDEAKEEYDNCINSIRADFDEHEEGAYLDKYDFPETIDEYCEGGDTIYKVSVEKKV